MEQDCPTVRVTEFVEDRKASPVQLEREIPVASDVRGAGVRAQCLSLKCRVGISVEIEHGSMSPNPFVGFLTTQNCSLAASRRRACSRCWLSLVH